MIPVFVDGKVIACVKYNSNLDFWDGRNWTCGSTGRHKGMTKLKNGQYVLIHGTQWQNEKDHAEVISAEQAFQEILKSGNHHLLDEASFSDLKQLMNDMITESE